LKEKLDWRLGNVSAHSLNLVATVDLILQLHTSIARKKSHFVGDWEGARAV
jgi:hypothetical protein